eukprot:8629246-Pyramimonas_sp.AAC.1
MVGVLLQLLGIAILKLLIRHGPPYSAPAAPPHSREDRGEDLEHEEETGHLGIPKVVEEAPPPRDAPAAHQAAQEASAL